MLISGQIYFLTIYVHIGVVNSGRHDSPHIRKSSLDHDSGGKKHVPTIHVHVHIGVLNSGRHDSPHVRKSSLDHDSGGKNRGCRSVFSEIFHITRLYQCNPHVS